MKPSFPLAFLAVACPVFLTATQGCASSDADRMAEEGPPLKFIESPPSSRPAYRLRVGDQVEIQFFYNPELDVVLPVGPDGTVSLDLVGVVRLQGHTVEELRTSLVDKYRGVIRRPEITINLRQFVTPKVYVGGEVKSPGIIPLDGRLTALQAIFQAGGFTDNAAPSDVVLIRAADDVPEPKFYKMDLQAHLARAMVTDPELAGADILFVPKSAIAEVNKFVEQYINKVVPFQTTLGLNYTFGKFTF